MSKYDEKSGFSDLSGVEKDMQRLHDLFKTTCKYQVICNQATNIDEKNKDFYLDTDSLNEMLQKTKDELENNNNNNNNNNNKSKSNYDGLIVVFSGHGYQDGIITSDGEEHDLREKIKRFFNAVNVPCLADRPKIFIIDACRREHDKLFPNKDDNQLQVKHVKGKIKNGKSQNNACIFEYEWYHPFVNVLEIYGNTPGNSAGANKKRGSLMIMLFSKYMEEYFTKIKTMGIESDDDNQETCINGEILMPMKYNMHKISDGNQVIEVNDTLLYNLHLQLNM